MLTSIKNALLSPSTLILLGTAILGAINAVSPMLHPETASVVGVIATLIGIVLSRIEHQTALNTPVAVPQPPTPPQA